MRSRTVLLGGSGSSSVSTSAPAGGTANIVAKFTAAYTVGDSSITDDGTNVTLAAGILRSAAGVALALSATAPVGTAVGTAASLAASNATTTGAGGAVNITAGNAAGAGDDGGNIFVVPGARAGSSIGGYTIVGNTVTTGLTNTNGPLTSGAGKGFIHLTTAAPSMAAVKFSATTTQAPGVESFKSASGTLGTLAAVASGDVLGVYTGRGARDTSVWDTNAAGMYVISSQTHTSANQGKYVQFRVVADSSAAQTNAWRVSSSPVGDLIPETTATYNIGGTSNTVLGLHTINVLLNAGVIGTSGVGVLALGNGTVPSTSPADAIQIFSVDASAGNATLGLRTEAAVVTETVASDRTLAAVINGTVYKICLKV